MVEIAGFVVTVVGVLAQLTAMYQELAEWEQKDIVVDRNWLPLAIESGILTGTESDYFWSNIESVATRELRSTHTTVIAANEDDQIKYRILYGREGSRQVLMKRVIS